MSTTHLGSRLMGSRLRNRLTSGNSSGQRQTNASEPCRVCLPGRPNHSRQRVVIDEDGRRIQVCEICGSLVAVLEQQRRAG